MIDSYKSKIIRIIVLSKYQIHVKLWMGWSAMKQYID